MIHYFKYGNKEKISYIINDILREYPKGTIDTLMNFTSTHDISRAINIFAPTYEFGGEWAWDIRNEDRNYQKNFKLTKKDYEKAKEIYMAYTYTLASMPGILSIFYGDEIGMQGLGNLANRRPFTWNKKDEELLRFFRKIGYMKNDLTFLKDADLKIIDITKDYIMFERYKEDESVLVVVNRTGDFKTFKVPSKYKEPIYTLKKSQKGVLSPYGAVTMK
jgi:4-alpha-glucanotransferase